MSSHVDHKARSDSIKALTVIFIILIASASLILLIKIVAKQNAVYNVRRCMVIILTLGVLLYSLFTLVVSARIIFSDHWGANIIACRTLVTSTNYGSFFFPFVYAFGLIAMALEIFMARDGKTPSAVVQFVYISVPWLLALVVVLPITMAGIDWHNNCRSGFSLARLKAHIWVCCLLPPIGAVAAYIFLVFTLKSSSNGAVPSSGTTQGTPDAPAPSVAYKHASYNTASPSGVVLASAPPFDPQQQFGPGYYPAHDYHGGSIPPPYQTIMAQNAPQYQHHYPGPGIPAQYPNYQHHQHQHHQHQHQPYYPPPPNYAPPPPGFGPSYYDTNVPAAPYQAQPPQPAAAPQPVSTNTTVPARDLRRETNALGLVSIVFFLCSFPYAVYTLGYSMNEEAERMDRLSQAIVNDTIYWVTVLRWFLLPICWFKYM